MRFTFFFHLLSIKYILTLSYFLAALVNAALLLGLAFVKNQVNLLIACGRALAGGRARACGCALAGAAARACGRAVAGGGARSCGRRALLFSNAKKVHVNQRDNKPMLRRTSELIPVEGSPCGEPAQRIAAAGIQQRQRWRR